MAEILYYQIINAIGLLLYTAYKYIIIYLQSVDRYECTILVKTLI